MARLMDLRNYFGVWKRCGNSRFFIKDTGNALVKIFLNPLDGLLVTVHGYSQDIPSYELTVRDAMKAPDEEVLESFKVNKAYPWIERAVKRFFHYQVFGWAADAVREYFGRDPLPGDKDMGNLLAYYEAGGKRYLEEGALPPGDRPMLEETLEAVRLTLMNTKGTISDYGRSLSEQDIEEALAQLGILEC